MGLGVAARRHDPFRAAGGVRCALRQIAGKTPENLRKEIGHGVAARRHDPSGQPAGCAASELECRRQGRAIDVHQQQDRSPTLRRRLRRAERAAHPRGCHCTVRGYRHAADPGGGSYRHAADPGGCLCHRAQHTAAAGSATGRGAPWRLHKLRMRAQRTPAAYLCPAQATRAPPQPGKCSGPRGRLTPSAACGSPAPRCRRRASAR
jgi:hypothetical protein